MPFSYRVGFFGWKIAARLGFQLKVNVSVMRDEEAGVFVAWSDDFLPEWGCVAEAETWEGLEKELQLVISEALEDMLGKHEKQPVFAPNICFAHQPA